MLGPSWLLLCLSYSSVVHFPSVRARVASLGPAVEAPPITEAPQAALGRLHKRDSPICGYINGIAQNSLTCNAPNDCYIFTYPSGFYSAKGACGQKAISSYYGPWGLCVNHGGGLCPNVASCSSAYTSVLFCNSQYPYCVRYEMRDVPSDPFYYVLLDCTTVSHSTPIQVLFTPTTTEATLGPGGSTPPQPSPTTVNRTPSPNPTPTLTPTTPTPTTPSPSPTPTSPNDTAPTTTPPSTSQPPTANPTSTSVPTTQSTSSPSGSPDSSSSGLTVGDKAGIAGAIVGAVAILTGVVSVAFPHETRIFLSYFLCCCCARRSVPSYSSSPIHMNHIG